jgi:hypothetical protein
MRQSIFLIAFCLVVSSAKGQVEYFLSGNVNLYSPEGAEGKSTYPIMWYDKETEPKFLIGGFGFGGFVTKQVNEKILLKGEVNISRHAYWEAIDFRDPGNVPIGSSYYGTSDLAVHLLPTINYRLGKNLFLGSGFGASVLLASYSRVQEFQVDTPDLVRNRYYRTITPLIPFELSMKRMKKFYSIRFEQSLGSRYKKELAEFKKDRYGIISFSIGWKLK